MEQPRAAEPFGLGHRCRHFWRHGDGFSGHKRLQQLDDGGHEHGYNQAGQVVTSGGSTQTGSYSYGTNTTDTTAAGSAPADGSAGTAPAAVPIYDMSGLKPESNESAVGAFFKGAAQGALNTLNGVQDIGIGLANLSLDTGPVGFVKDFAEHATGLNLDIPSPDWSRGKITDESDGVHKWSKIIGGNAAVIMPWTKLPAVLGSWAGVAKGAIIGRSAAAAEAAQVAVAEGAAASSGASEAAALEEAVASFEGEGGALASGPQVAGQVAPSKLPGGAKTATEVAQELGKAGEKAAGIAKNTQRIESLSGKAAYRIPDELTATTLTEVKNVAYQHFSTQLQDSLHYAMMTGRQMILKVRPDTVLSKELQDVIKAGWIKLEFIP